MILYLTIIFIAMTIISLLNIFLGGPAFECSPWFVVLMVVISTAFEFALDAIIAIIIKKMPDKYFTMDKKHFYVSKKVVRFYERCKIRKWKDKIWELGKAGGFSKEKLLEPNNPKYIELFIIESNKGIIVHRLTYFTGFLVVFLFPLEYALVIGLPIALVNLFLNILPTMVLRYNIPKLKNLHARLLRKEKEDALRKALSKRTEKAERKEVV